MYRKIGRFETNYQIDLFCAVCVFILLHFVLLEKITFRFIGPPHFVLPDLSYPSKRDTVTFSKARHIKVKGCADFGRVVRIGFYRLPSGDSIVKTVEEIKF